MSISEELFRKLMDVECRDSSYHPSELKPLIFDTAKGSFIWDVDGNQYIDLCAGFGVLALGHSSDIFRRTLEEYINNTNGYQIVHGMGDIYPSKSKILLLARLAQILPPHLSKGMLALTGGQAVEVAIKSALLAKKETGFIAFKGGYHGLDLGVLSLTHREDFKLPFESWFTKNHVVYLDYGCEESAVVSAIKELNRIGYGFNAIIVEPIQGRAGIRCPPSGWLTMLKNVAHKEDGLLIFDEIFTGLGRTGRITFASEIPCDLLCLGKALGGGFALSCCFGTEAVMEKWPLNESEALHTGTFFGHPLSCQIAYDFCGELLTQDLCIRAKSIGSEAKEFLWSSLKNESLVAEIRGEGLMLGITFTKNGHGVRCMDSMRSSGVIVLANGEHGEGVSITPALNIPKDTLWIALGILIEWIKTAK